MINSPAKNEWELGETIIIKIVLINHEFVKISEDIWLSATKQ